MVLSAVVTAVRDLTDFEPEEERLPYLEGWRHPAEVIDQAQLNHSYHKILTTNEHVGDEIKIIGLGALGALKASFLGIGSWLFEAHSSAS